jgi:putative LysE/RhtB family amino acid efflux pump
VGTALLTGFGLGLLVAAQVGPIWLLCARSSLRFGARSGLAIGAGAAIVDLTYAALGVAGAASLVRISAIRVGVGLVGAGFLLYLGGRTLVQSMRVRLGAEADAEVLRPAAAFRTSLAATASNPTTILSWAAVFGAASVAHIASHPSSATVLVGAVGVGSFTWFALLAAAAGRLGRRLADRHVRIADALSGAGIAGFGGVLGWRTLRS